MVSLQGMKYEAREKSNSKSSMFFEIYISKVMITIDL